MISGYKKDTMIRSRSFVGQYEYVVYDEMDNGIVVTFGKTLDEVAKYLCCDVNIVKKMVYQGYLYRKRFSCERVWTVTVPN